MNEYAKKFLDEVGPDEVSRICAAAGTKLVYYMQVVKGKRNFSRSLAAKLEEASDNRLDRSALVFGAHPHQHEDRAQ